MRNYTCAEYVNTANLRRILRARKVDRDQLAQLKSLEKRLRAQGGDHHRLDFAPPRSDMRRRRPVRPPVPQAGEGRIDAEPPRSEEGRPQGPRPRPVHRRGHGQRAPRDPQPALSELGLACPALQRYVDEREAVLAETGLGRDGAKQAFITLMYGGPNGRTPRRSWPSSARSS